MRRGGWGEGVGSHSFPEENQGTVIWKRYSTWCLGQESQQERPVSRPRPAPRPAPCRPKPHNAGVTGAQGGQRGRRPAGCPRAGALGGRLISMPGFAAAAAPQSAPGPRDTDAGSAEGSAVCVQSRVPGLLAPTSSYRQLPAGPCPQNLGGEVAWGPAGQGRAVAVEGRAGPPRPRSPQSGLQFATCCRTSLVKKGCLH